MLKGSCKKLNDWIGFSEALNRVDNLRSLLDNFAAYLIFFW